MFEKFGHRAALRLSLGAALAFVLATGAARADEKETKTSVVPKAPDASPDARADRAASAQQRVERFGVAFRRAISRQMQDLEGERQQSAANLVERVVEAVTVSRAALRASGGVVWTAVARVAKGKRPADRSIARLGAVLRQATLQTLAGAKQMMLAGGGVAEAARGDPAFSRLGQRFAAFLEQEATRMVLRVRREARDALRQAQRAAGPRIAQKPLGTGLRVLGREVLALAKKLTGAARATGLRAASWIDRSVREVRGLTEAFLRGGEMTRAALVRQSRRVATSIRAALRKPQTALRSMQAEARSLLALAKKRAHERITDARSRSRRILRLVTAAADRAGRILQAIAASHKALSAKVQLLRRAGRLEAAFVLRAAREQARALILATNEVVRRASERLAGASPRGPAGADRIERLRTIARLLPGPARAAALELARDSEARWERIETGLLVAAVNAITRPRGIAAKVKALSKEPPARLSSEAKKMLEFAQKELVSRLDRAKALAKTEVAGAQAAFSKAEKIFSKAGLRGKQALDEARASWVAMRERVARSVLLAQEKARAATQAIALRARFALGLSTTAQTALPAGLRKNVALVEAAAEKAPPASKAPALAVRSAVLAVEKEVRARARDLVANASAAALREAEAAMKKLAPPSAMALAAKDPKGASQKSKVMASAIEKALRATAERHIAAAKLAAETLDGQARAKIARATSAGPAKLGPIAAAAKKFEAAVDRTAARAYLLARERVRDALKAAATKWRTLASSVRGSSPPPSLGLRVRGAELEALAARSPGSIRAELATARARAMSWSALMRSASDALNTAARAARKAIEGAGKGADAIDRRLEVALAEARKLIELAKAKGRAIRDAVESFSASALGRLRKAPAPGDLAAIRDAGVRALQSLTSTARRGAARLLLTARQLARGLAAFAGGDKPTAAWRPPRSSRTAIAPCAEPSKDSPTVGAKKLSTAKPTAGAAAPGPSPADRTSTALALEEIDRMVGREDIEELAGGEAARAMQEGALPGAWLDETGAITSARTEAVDALQSAVDAKVEGVSIALAKTPAAELQKLAGAQVGRVGREGPLADDATQTKDPKAIATTAAVAGATASMRIAIDQRVPPAEIVSLAGPSAKIVEKKGPLETSAVAPLAAIKPQEAEKAAKQDPREFAQRAVLALQKTLKNESVAEEKRIAAVVPAAEVARAAGDATAATKVPDAAAAVARASLEAAPPGASRDPAKQAERALANEAAKLEATGGTDALASITAKKTDPKALVAAAREAQGSEDVKLPKALAAFDPGAGKATDAAKDAAKRAAEAAPAKAGKPVQVSLAPAPVVVAPGRLSEPPETIIADDASLLDSPWKMPPASVVAFVWGRAIERAGAKGALAEESGEAVTPEAVADVKTRETNATGNTNTDDVALVDQVWSGPPAEVATVALGPATAEEKAQAGDEAQLAGSPSVEEIRVKAADGTRNDNAEDAGLLDAAFAMATIERLALVLPLTMGGGALADKGGESGDAAGTEGVEVEPIKLAVAKTSTGASEEDVELVDKPWAGAPEGLGSYGSGTVVVDSGDTDGGGAPVDLSGPARFKGPREFPIPESLLKGLPKDLAEGPKAVTADERALLAGVLGVGSKPIEDDTPGKLAPPRRRSAAEAQQVADLLRTEPAPAAPAAVAPAQAAPAILGKTAFDRVIGTAKKKEGAAPPSASSTDEKSLLGGSR